MRKNIENHSLWSPCRSRTVFMTVWEIVIRKCAWLLQSHGWPQSLHTLLSAFVQVHRHHSQYCFQQILGDNVYPGCACKLSHFSHVGFFVTSWTIARQAPLSTGFSKQENWNGLSCPFPGDPLEPGIKPTSLMSPELIGGFFTTSAIWEPHVYARASQNVSYNLIFWSHFSYLVKVYQFWKNRHFVHLILARCHRK